MVKTPLKPVPSGAVKVELGLTVSLDGSLSQVARDLERVSALRAALKSMGYTPRDFVTETDNGAIRGFSCPVPSGRILSLLAALRATGFLKTRTPRGRLAPPYQVYCRTADEPLATAIRATGCLVLDPKASPDSALNAR
jgi:hypothetical protein